MLLALGALITFVGGVLLYKARIPGGVNTSNLGWVSEQWLAEYRASHPS
jgi:hypothetical protein